MARPATSGRALATRSLLLPRTPRCVRDARAHVREDLAATALPDGAIEDVLLVVSELVSNSLRHARPLPGDDAVALRWDCDEASVVVRVTDGGGPTFPRARPPATSALGGRGLAMVAAVSADWGVERAAGQVTVWAVVAADDAVTTTDRLGGARSQRG